MPPQCPPECTFADVIKGISSDEANQCVGTLDPPPDDPPHVDAGEQQSRCRELTRQNRQPVSSPKTGRQAARRKLLEYTPGRAQVQVGGVRTARTEIRGKGTGAAQFPIEAVSERVSREQ